MVDLWIENKRRRREVEDHEQRIKIAEAEIADIKQRLSAVEALASGLHHEQNVPNNTGESS